MTGLDMQARAANGVAVKQIVGERGFCLALARVTGVDLRRNYAEVAILWR